MQIIAIANQKGGVAKTTTAVNLAVALAHIAHKRVLLIDTDAQGNATTSLGVDKSSLTHTIADVLIDSVPLMDAIIATENLDIIGGSHELAGIDVTLAGIEDAALLLTRALQQGLANGMNYDYVIFDTAPSLSLLTVNALVAADGVIIPMQCEYYALEGVVDLLSTIDKLAILNPKLHVQGVVRTLYDSRNMLAQDVSKELQKYFGDKLYKTTIPRNVRLAEAPSFGRSIFDYERSSAGARAYHRLMEEVLKQMDA